MRTTIGVARWLRRGAAVGLAGALALADGAGAQAASAGAGEAASIDGIIGALYASISGPIGQDRDFARFRSLFAPDGRLLPTSAQAPNGHATWTPEQYWERNAETLRSIGFTESEIGRSTETFGNITHVFSTYESYRYDRGEPDGPFARGINSIQLVWHEDRYWIVSLTWDSERPDNPIPARYIGR